MSLREHHLQKCKKEGKPSIEQGDVIILKCDLSNRAFWRLGLVESLIPGSDEKVQAAVIKVGDKSTSGKTIHLKRSIKHLYPIEVKAKARGLPQCSKATDDSNTIVSDSENNSIDANSTVSSEEVNPSNNEASLSRPRRQAAIAGKILRRTKK